MEISDYRLEDKCKIKKITMGCELINPILMSADNRGLTEQELVDSECSWYKDRTDQYSRLVRFVNKDNDRYEGSCKIKENLCKTMVLLQNKKTNKVQVIEVSGCRLGRVLEKPSCQTNYDNDEMQSTYDHNRSNLLKAFGSKKSKRVSDVGLKMRINNDIMSSQMKRTTADVKIDVKELELADQSVDTCLPLCHKDATDPAGVYLLEDFMSQQELDSMEDEAFTIDCLMPFTEEESGYSKFFIDSLDRLQNKISFEKIKILLYVEALLRFISLQEKRIKKKDIIENVSPFSPLIAKKILEEFTISSTQGRTRNVTMDDKIVIHIMVLIIISCNFSCNLKELSNYLPNFNVKKIGQIAHALRLSTRDKVTWFLKLPLPPPRSSFMRRRK